MKSDTLKLKNNDQFFKCYKDIFTHGLHQGICTPTLESASKESTLGRTWKTLHPSKQNQCDVTAYILGQFLNHDLFPKDTDDLRNIVSATNSNGYTTLHNLVQCMKHPALSDEVVEITIP
eukprot:10261701-Ditylum_brightwellii.AAC.1